MTNVAIILFNVEMGKADDVVKALKEIEGVKQVDVVYGVYDLVVRVEAENMEKLSEIVSWYIRRLQNVQATLTMVVM